MDPLKALNEYSRKDKVMTDRRRNRILTINSGSSSIKFSLYHLGQSEASEELVFSGQIERIGLSDSLFYASNSDGKSLIERHLQLSDHDAGLKTLLEWIRSHISGQDLEAVGHRVVHGGSKYNEPQLINPEVLVILRDLLPLSPDHLPHELKAIEAIIRMYPTLRQVACFDTAFHQHMPKVAQLYALPRQFLNEGIRRYGFHGLSYEYIMQELTKHVGTEAANQRVIIAHLGNGASLAAIRRGRSVETTMGLIPAGGLVMSTRSGDLDPGVMLYLLREKSVSPSTLSDIVNRDAGLFGLSGITSDMKDLLDKERRDSNAAEAIEVVNHLSRYALAIEALRRVARIRNKAVDIIQIFEQKLATHRAYIENHDEDMPEVLNWHWSED